MVFRLEVQLSKHQYHRHERLSIPHRQFKDDVVELLEALQLPSGTIKITIKPRRELLCLSDEKGPRTGTF